MSPMTKENWKYACVDCGARRLKSYGDRCAKCRDKVETERWAALLQEESLRICPDLPRLEAEYEHAKEMRKEWAARAANLYQQIEDVARRAFNPAAERLCEEQELHSRVAWYEHSADLLGEELKEARHPDIPPEDQADFLALDESAEEVWDAVKQSRGLVE